jgi:hypothetical protein
MKKRQLQQGDVIIKEIEALPEVVNPVTKQNGRIIIMEGEAAGHNHVIDTDKAALWVLEKGGAARKYLKVAELVTIYHDEHKPLLISAGIYEIGRIQEYDYFTMLERIVND